MKFRKLCSFWIGLFTCYFCLTGCVQYDVGISFDNQVHGQIIQHIKLGKQLQSFNPEQSEEWLHSIESRSQQVHGRVKRLSEEEIEVIIPFYNGVDLETKFNQFFNPVEPKKSGDPDPTAADLPEIKSQLKIKQNNFLLVLRNRLNYDLDLRSLSVLAANGNVLISPGSVLDLEFRLNTPWGARSIPTAPDAIAPESHNEAKQLIWNLKPGQLNQIEAIFWIPSPIGIGAVVIILFMGFGAFLKYQLLPIIGIGKQDGKTGKIPVPQ